ncbi:glycosyltransferase family 1 protein [Patescibacteria group bacterium]|nr:MAG: glycosyltransferase family 1 protein [Patescibacteria group bacterium]
MRIGIDARTILNPERGEAIGVGHYTYQLIRHLLAIDKENEYVLFFDFRVREKDVKKFSLPNVKIKFYPFSDYKKYLPVAYSEILGTATLVREKLDVLHATSPESRIPLGYQGKTIVTFHDLSVFEHPECFPKVKGTRDKTIMKLMANKADRIISVSSATRDALKKHLSVPAEKVAVVHSGIDRRFFDEPAGADIPKLLGRFGIERQYILFLGTLEPSKNVTRLLEAFAKFKEKMLPVGGGSFQYQLVVAGKRGWLSEEYRQLVKDLGLAKDVVFTGYVVGDEIVPLFKHSQFFIMPSLSEGFGMTVLEAFATGTPSIISNVSSLPEVAGDAARFVNPVDVTEMTEAMVSFANNEQERNQYIQKGYERAKLFDWEKTARETLAVYKSLVE